MRRILMRRAGLTLLTALLGLAALAACRPADTTESPWPNGPAGGAAQPQAEAWEPSAEWLDLYYRDQAVSDLLQASLDAEDRDEQLELYEEYKAAQREMQDYFVENPGADAPCATRTRYAPPELWCTAADLDLELPFQEL